MKLSNGDFEGTALLVTFTSPNLCERLSDAAQALSSASATLVAIDLLSSCFLLRGKVLTTRGLEDFSSGSLSELEELEELEEPPELELLELFYYESDELEFLITSLGFERGILKMTLCSSRGL